MRNLIIAGLILIIAGCTSNPTGDFTTVKVKEVEQVGSYTYLLVKGKGPEYWVAVPSMEARPGETYSYQGGMMMENFYSKELDRTFEKVMFLEGFYSGGASASNPISQLPGNSTQGSKADIEKVDIKVEVVEGDITISDLFSDPGAYEGKSIRIKGEVTKFSSAIMDRNWVHVQDGTEFEGKFDLTATSQETFEVGSTVTLEGILALNKDFGYGYNYEILLEQATAVN